MFQSFHFKTLTNNSREKIINNQNIKSSYFNPNMNYYICSYGGSGSTVLYEYLKNFGNAYHIHDRYPPNELTYIGSENTTNPVYREWFNTTQIPEDKLDNYKVIFIYRNPIRAIYSRFIQKNIYTPYIKHLQHIKCKNNGNIPLRDVLHYKNDLYGITEFYDNYTIPQKRNYTIYCVRYEDMFENMHILNETLGIPTIPTLIPKKRERNQLFPYVLQLTNIYNSLLNRMKEMPFIKKNEPLTENNTVTENNT